MTLSNSSNQSNGTASATEARKLTDQDRPIIALVSDEPSLIETLATALPDFDIVEYSKLEPAGLSWPKISAMVVDLDTIGITNQLTLMSEASAAGFEGESYAVGGAADAALDRHLKLLNQPGLFVHGDDTDMAILNVTLKRDLQRSQKPHRGANGKPVGIAGTAREIAGLIKAWNARLAHERGSEDQQQ